jgi:glycosyltransferase involved in cell wall biosynthesis
VSGLSFDVFQVVKDMGIPLLATLHDFFYICPTVKLLENGSHYCGGKGENCAQCLNGQICVSKQVDYLSYWQIKCIEALSMCDALSAPSESAKEIYAKTYPELAERIRVIGHGMDSFTMVIPELQQVKPANVVHQIEKNLDSNYVIAGWAYQEGIDSRNSDIFVRLQDKDGAVFEYLALMQCRPDISCCKGDYRYLYSGFQVQIPDMAFCRGPFQMQLIIRNEGNEYCSEILIIKNYIRREKNRRRIAFLGGLNEAKGSKIASQMIQQSGNLYDWYIIGGIGDPGLATLEKKNVQKTNWYKRENISLILRQNQIDLVCILPIWPETFCYTVSEAQLAGIPILTTDIGALGERMRHDQTGWLVEKDTSAKDILNRITRIFDDPVEYQKVFSHTESFSVKTISQMCAEYADLYSKFSCPDHSWEFDPKQIYQAYNLCLAAVRGTDMDSDGELLLRVNELEATLSGIEQSLEYRMVRFFNREKLPFKRQIKWLIGFAYRVYVKLFRK